MTTAMPGAGATFIPRLDGSHRVEDVGNGRVIVRDVEVFGEMEDGPLGRVDESTLRKIRDATNGRMRLGGHPMVILTHDDGDVPVVGRIPSDVRLGVSASSGRKTIYADIEMPAENFEAYIATNRYPRRSAEINKKSLTMLQLSLLGRNAPAVELPDTHFSSPNSDTVAIGSDTLPPTVFAAKETPTMTAAELLSAVQAMTPDDRKAIRAVFEASEETDEEKKKREEAEAKAKAEEEEKAKEMEADEEAKHSASGSIAKMQTKLLDATNTIAKLQARLDQTEARASAMEVRAKYEPIVHSLKNIEGFSTVDVATEVARLSAMPDDKSRDAHLDHIRQNYRREVTGSALVNASASFAAAPGDQTVKFSDADNRKIVTLATRDGISYDEAAAKLNIKLPH
jgi:hypothetical protein